MSAILGLACKLYYQTTGTRAAWPVAGPPPNLALIGNVRDLTLNLSTGEADVTTRGNNGWKAMAATLTDGSAEFEMVWNPGDTAFDAIQAAFFAKTSLAFAILDGLSNVDGSTGLWADFIITNFSREEALEEAVKAKVTIKPAFSDVAPEWVETTVP